MANVLLINPDPVARVLPPLGINYIAENLRKHGHKTTIVDMGFEKDFTVDGIDFVGITSTTLIYSDSKKIIKKIKEINPNIPIILGGVHSSLLPDYVLKDSGADAVVVGEGEEIMVQIVNGNQKPDGLIYAEELKDLDQIPFPTFDCVDMDKYFNYPGTDRIRWSLPQPSIAMITHRGCPFACSFCASKNLFNRRVRSRSVPNVMAEVDHHIEKFGVKSIYFYDDTLTMNNSWMVEFCEALKKRNIQWICGTRVDTVNEKMLIMMRDSGCKYISYGVESGSNRVLKEIIKKGTTIEKMEEIIKLTDKLGIGIILNYMFGLPGETEEDMKLTLKAIKRIPADAAEFSVFIPLPGSELGQGLDWTVYSSDNNPYHVLSPIHTPEYSLIIKDYHTKAIKSFYFSYRFIFRSLRLFLKPRQLFFASKSFFKLLRESVLH